MKTELQQYKNLFESLIDLLEHPAWIKNMHGHYVHVNQPFIQFMGMKRDEILGKDDHQLLPFAMAEVCKTSDQEAIRSGNRICFEDHYTDTNGDITLFSVCKSVVKNDAGEILYTVGIATSCDKLNKLELENESLKEKQDESNTALRAILDLRQYDKKNMENHTTDALNGSVLPYLKKMQMGHLDSMQSLLLDTVIGNIESMMADHSPGMDTVFLKLTPAELPVAKLIRSGLSGKEIAEQLCLSVSTINTHRRNIRKRLGLNKRKTNLRQYLLAQ